MPPHVLKNIMIIYFTLNPARPHLELQVDFVSILSLLIQ